MIRTVCCAAVILALVATFITAQGGDKYTIKIEKTPLPKELKPAIAKLLKEDAIQLHDGQNNLIAEIWLRREVPVEDITPEQVQNGLTYRELSETTVLGAIRVPEAWTDYRKQKVPAGVYTMRLGFQPEDGDHAGSALHKEFVLLSAAAKDTKSEPMEQRKMIEMSIKSIATGHPAVYMLFPNSKPAAEPKLDFKERGHVVLNFRQDVNAKGQKTAIGFGLTLIGAAE